MTKTLLGMGAAAMDTVISCSSLPRGDSFQRVDSEQLIPGGSCANMLCAFAALGGQARLVAKIGDDQFGRQFSKTLAEDGVDGSNLLVNKGGVTLHTYIWAAKGGEHCIFVNLGDSLMALAAEEVDARILDGVDLFYSDLFPSAPAIKLAKICQERHIPVIICLECTPSFMESIGVKHEEIITALSLADLIISGREGYVELADAADYQQALASVYQSFQPRLGAICTAGSDGALWINEQGTIKVPAYDVQAIDSTGAGDGFLGAFLYSYFVLGQSRVEAMTFAAAVGAIKCLHFGPRIKITQDEVFAFIEDHK